MTTPRQPMPERSPTVKPSGDGRRTSLSLSVLLMLLITAVALPLGLLGAGTLWSQYRLERTQAEAQLVDHAQTLALLIDKEIDRHAAVGAMLAASPALSRGDTKSFGAVLRAAASSLSRDLPPGSHPALLRLIDAQGNVLADTGGHPAAKARSLPHLRKALQSGQVEVSNLFAVRETGEKVIAVATPVFALGPDGTPQGRPTGIISITIPRSRFTAIANSATLPAGGLASILDDDKVIIARSRGDVEAAGRKPRPETQQTFDTADRGTNHSTSFEGVPVVGGFAHAPKSGFVAALLVPEETLEAPIRAALLRTAGLGVIVLIAGCAAAFLLARRVVGAFHTVPLAASDFSSAAVRPSTGIREADDLAEALAANLVERWKAEADLRRLAGTLEATVEKRTAELLATEAALRQSQKMEAVGQLTGGLAHDFNNLLIAITGSLELLKSRVAAGRTADIERYVSTAQTAAMRAAALTHRLLAFSRRQTLDPKPTDANQLIEGMVELIRRTMGPAIGLTLNLAPEPWQTLCDGNQLENGLLNLCLNARDAMPNGGALSITTANRTLGADTLPDGLVPGDYIIIEVTDTGAGMTPEVMAHAFDPFFTTKPTGLGTGLGLSMIYGFVRQSGGHIAIDSKLGFGTTMRLCLPRHIGGTAAAGEAPHPPSPVKPAGHATVMVVDDEEAVRMLVTDVLDELGYQVIEAVDGPSALNILHSDTPVDLLITDVGLPGGLNGRQLADAARAERGQLKVLFITGYAETSLTDGTQLSHGMHVMTKPFRLDTLAERITAIVEAP
ncbi:MAG TPA: ATP-binding protein [Stellaceae bacterium]|nr:ATP-binding protein [Stellaceae bacterium]